MFNILLKKCYRHPKTMFNILLKKCYRVGVVVVVVGVAVVVVGVVVVVVGIVAVATKYKLFMKQSI